MQAFIAATDMEYRSRFMCRICAEHAYTVIVDGQAIGMNRKLFQAHQCCIANGAATVNVEW